MISTLKTGMQNLLKALDLLFITVTATEKIVMVLQVKALLVLIFPM